MTAMARRYLWSPDMIKPVFLNNEKSETESHAHPRTGERCYTIPSICLGYRQFESLWECPDCHRVIHSPSLAGGYSPAMQTLD